MNRLLFLLLVLFAGNLAYAQQPEATAPEATPVESNCYQKYAIIFEKRGAFEVEDGTYDDVIITMRRGSTAECFNGKVVVAKGFITDMFIRFSDNTYEKIEKKYKSDWTHVAVVNGISQTFVTKDDELINVMFVKKIKPKKKEYQKAPEPIVDDY